MSFITRSGMPALSQTTREKVEAEYQQFYNGIQHLVGKKDFEYLYIPTYEEFRRLDIINTSHPMQNQLEQHSMEIEADEDIFNKKTAEYNSQVISQHEYDYEMSCLRLKQLKREGVFNLTSAFKTRIAEQEKEVENLKELMSTNDIQDIASPRQDIEDAVVESVEEVDC